MYTIIRYRTHLLRGLLELIMPAFLRVEVRKRRILEYLAALRAFDALAACQQQFKSHPDQLLTRASTSAGALATFALAFPIAARTAASSSSSSIGSLLLLLEEGSLPELLLRFFPAGELESESGVDERARFFFPLGFLAVSSGVKDSPSRKALK